MSNLFDDPDHSDPNLIDRRIAYATQTGRVAKVKRGSNLKRGNTKDEPSEEMLALAKEGLLIL